MHEKTTNRLGASLAAATAAIMILALALGCSSSSTGGGSSAGFNCQNPPSKGPLSTACTACGAQQCASDQSAVETSCASLVSCIEACQCGTGTCESTCVGKASPSCQKLITTLGDCTKMSTACSTACTD